MQICSEMVQFQQNIQCKFVSAYFQQKKRGRFTGRILPQSENEAAYRAIIEEVQKQAVQWRV